MIPFSPPRIDKKIIDEVVAALKSGWITTGPRTMKFEKEITKYCGCKKTIALSSATAGLEIMLRWFGVKEGDEVVVPAYTYCATANVVIHCGAKPVFVDINRDDFNISIEAISQAITERTKVIMPVDLGGFPVDMDEINELVNKKEIKRLFHAHTDIQRMLGRILVILDAAHSLGAVYKGKKVGSTTDITVFSFHAVKNLTTAEGGAVSMCLPEPFDNNAVYDYLNVYTLHGQDKDALAKTKKGSWRYDVTEAGYKANMTDILSAIGLVELKRYDNDTLIKRKEIFDTYNEVFKKYSWAQTPVYESGFKKTSYHVYMLRIRNITEMQRDEIIQRIFDKDVAVNVHFQPLPMLSFYKRIGYNMADFPVAFDNYSREITLPVFYDLTKEQMKTVTEAVINSVNETLGL